MSRTVDVFNALLDRLHIILNMAFRGLRYGMLIGALIGVLLAVLIDILLIVLEPRFGSNSVEIWSVIASGMVGMVLGCFLWGSIGLCCGFMTLIFLIPPKNSRRHKRIFSLGCVILAWAITCVPLSYLIYIWNDFGAEPPSSLLGWMFLIVILATCGVVIAASFIISNRLAAWYLRKFLPEIPPPLPA